MSLFPGIKVDGHGYKEGLDPNGGSLQSVIEKNIFVEAGRGWAALPEEIGRVRY